MTKRTERWATIKPTAATFEKHGVLGSLAHEPMIKIVKLGNRFLREDYSFGVCLNWRRLLRKEVDSLLKRARATACEVTLDFQGEQS